MTANELINDINRESDLYVDESEDYVKVYNCEGKHDDLIFTIPKDARSFFDITWNCMQPEFVLDDYERELLEKIITEYLKTEIKDRTNPTEKYRLLMDGSDDGMPKYVESIKNDDDGLSFVYGEPKVFTEEELTDLKQSYPDIADTIDKIKVFAGEIY
ncbi:hypothetical protein [Limosilactobacillus fastidiosus]|uniref:Uncharacterized protein n=1 Tax=Limosilactobacillus fastidiosus TaxID=2759855 RepID=A0A7W3TY00_9LACO|nr:hypothetical protein [Limosilactobacillus fastidiosus]MBB1063210.1 hypothetical protein [Limosilactobacillus fastidiosus]MBB1085374.1 hypothetical protein [Limosilactobacillus fastidiosus]MCD7083676.1 hypothetical protein [Limosilactobacillus fastidiosus]MCD7085356.1 hypothetical protein [Limosilactobacillus fastidiosus]MCD7114879.1 hypothetical protein [Limosilactobacillus fastidiosus]